ncbi:hypothetical protein AB5I41_25380 [Sphingomonas sp. MMS24-JH45]
MYDYDIATGDLSVLKVQEIPSGYDAAKYDTQRLKIAARDGTMVPVSIVYPKGFPATARARSSSTPMAPTATPSRRALRPDGSACSTAASPMPSRTSGAATTSASNGITTASWRSGATPSPTSST